MKHAALAVVLALACGAVSAETPAAEFTPTKETEQRFLDLEEGSRVRVVNRYGNIYARFGGYENRMEMLATAQRLDPSLAELEVRTESGPGTLRIDVAPRGDETTTRDRIDLVLFVPRGITLDAETDGDLIAVKKIKSDLIASSRSGDIQARGVKGSVQLKTARGKIQATLATGATSTPQRLTTETGEIEVYVGEDADMDVSLTTSGEISTDFSIEIEHRRFEEPGKHGIARIGNGGAKLTLESKRGRVRLLRLQKEFLPED